MSRHSVEPRHNLDNSNGSDQLLTALVERKGDTTYADFASDVAHTESMLRAYMTGRSDAGLDTLCVLLAWDPSLEQMIIDRMLVRGDQLRKRIQSRQREAVGVS